MKVLWVCNLVIPMIAEELNIDVPFAGGWLTGIINALSNMKDIELVVSFPYSSEESGYVNGISFLSFGKRSYLEYSNETEEEIKAIIRKADPDIIHIFGTEYPHALAAVKAAKSLGILSKVVISLQGLVSVYAQHYYAGLPAYAIRRNTLRDFLKHDNIINQRKKYLARGRYEIEAIKMAEHVIGRTQWDLACAMMINSEIQYHHCNETLRSSFYDHEWDVNTCEKHSVFVSQSYYPIKGFHLMLKAFSLISDKYSDAHLYTTGLNPLMTRSIKNALHKTYYQEYLCRLIKEYNLEDRVTFLGSLSELQMRDRILNSHVFALPSAIENSPNSLGEAMLMGVPCVAADVGGVSDLLVHNKEGFIYQFDAPYMLAHYIDKIFSDNEIAYKFSANAKKHASKTHSPELNNSALVDIYCSISG